MVGVLLILALFVVGDLDLVAQEPASAAAPSAPVNLLNDQELTALLLTPKRGGGLRLGEAFNMAASGYSIEVWSPKAWIRHQAALAQQEMRPFTLADVNDEMRADVWRITAHPSTPSKMNQTNGASSVSHVVVRNKNKSFIIQPLSKEPFAERVQNLAGATLNYEGLKLTFPADQVRQLWGADEDQQFWISVIGPNWSYDFEIKKKHFPKRQ